MKRKKTKQGRQAPDTGEKPPGPPANPQKHEDTGKNPHNSKKPEILPAPSGDLHVSRFTFHASPGRKWAYRLAALVLGPLLVFGGFELALRLAGYGYPTNFFRPLRIGDEDCLVENDKFGLRFFPPELARSPPPVVMKAHKAAGTFRIFILGESAALGDPRPAYAAGRYLQALLEARFSGQKFEVLCLAMTAINSHALLPLARECARHEGDCWILYLGNNEMVGPFGAATVFGPSAPSRSLVRLNLAVQQARLGQLLAAWGRKLRGGASPNKTWAGMEMFLHHQVPPGDPARENVYLNFQENLQDIITAGTEAGAKLVLSTVAVNLRDSPPFASGATPNLSATDRAVCDALLRQAAVAEKETNYLEAAKWFDQAARIDRLDAGVQFRLGDCLLRSTNSAMALPSFEAARDLDALPFRADSHINAIITQLGRQYEGRNLAFFDAAGLFATNTPTGIPGHEFFYEHVHFNFDGNYLLGRAWAERVAALLPPGATNHATAAWATQPDCERRIGLTDWNRYSVLEDMERRISQPPFTNQFKQDPRLAAWQLQMRELRRQMDGEAPEARKLYLEALQRAPDDQRLHENFAEFLEGVGDLPAAVAEWEQVRALIPQHHLAYYQAGRLLLRQAKLAEARTRLSEAVALRPDLSEGWLELGNIDAMEGKPEPALRNYERARKLLPQDPRVYYHAGKAFSQLGQTPRALQGFAHALALRPNYWEARYAFGEEMAFVGNLEEARAQFEEALRLRPDYSMAHLNLGVILAKQGHLEDAARQFEETKRLDPQNKLATEYLDKLKAQKPPSEENTKHQTPNTK
ncbi:MAG TPA: tetratricopeptide repeat protein [Candidatus Binatia bacterium]|nr:tetratricopeptide repeat protein [Candidatus Binatia bacterium]